MTDADFVLYVTANANLSQCNPGVALAFATPCQLEKEYDRFAISECSDFTV